MNRAKNSAQYILDASVVVKWFSSEKEEFVAQADEVRKLFLNGSGELCKRAFALARQLEITFYDAVYMALAALLNSQAYYR